jgi:hypothetical protein
LKLATKRWLLGSLSALALLAVISAMAIGNSGIPLATVPAITLSDLPPSVQAAEKLLEHQSQLPTGPALNSSVLAGTATPAEIQRTVEEFLPAVLPYLDLQSHWADSWDQLMSSIQSGSVVGAEEGLSTASLNYFLSPGQWAAVGFGIDLAVGIAVCVLTSGLFCFLVAVILFTLAVLLLWILSQETGPETNAIGVGQRYLQAFANATSGIGAAAYSMVAAMGDAEGTWAALAEGAALAQLGSTWNPALDLLNSTLAYGFAGAITSLFSTVTDQVGVLITNFASSFTGSNPGCGIEYGYAGATPDSFTDPYNPSGSSDCGQPSTFSGSVPNDGLEALQSWAVPACSGTPSISTSTAALFINSETSVSSVTGQFLQNVVAPYAVWGTPGDDISVYSLSGALLGHTVDGTAGGSEGNWTFGPVIGNTFNNTTNTWTYTGPAPDQMGYMLCAASGSESIGLADAFPINDATEMANVADGVQSNPELEAAFGANPNYDGGTVFAVTTASTFGFVETEDAGVECSSMYGNESTTHPSEFVPSVNAAYCSQGSLVEENLTYELYAMAHTAVNYGEAWWAFLTYLGYDNENEVPNACLILTPSSLMPATIPWETLQYMSVFQILMVFTDELSVLDSVFNANTTAPPDGDFTFCGVTAPIVDCGNGLSGAVNQTLREELLGNITPDLPSGLPYTSSWWYCSYGMASEGVGYLYLPSDLGTFGNSLADARTWTNSIGVPTDGILTIAGTLGGVGPIPINTTWEIPSRGTNPTDTTLSYLQNSTSFEADPERCVTATTNATDCAVNQYPEALGTVVGNSTLSNGSAYLTHVSGSAGAAVYLVGCETVGGNSTIFEVTEHTQTSGDCNFTGFHWTWGNETCITNPNSSLCKTGCDPATQDCCLLNCLPANFCLTFPIIDVFASEFGSWFGSFSFFGIGAGSLTGLGQALGCVIGILVLGIVVVFFAWLAFTLVNSYRRSR